MKIKITNEVTYSSIEVESEPDFTVSYDKITLLCSKISVCNKIEDLITFKVTLGFIERTDLFIQLDKLCTAYLRNEDVHLLCNSYCIDSVLSSSEVAAESKACSEAAEHLLYYIKEHDREFLEKDL